MAFVAPALAAVGTAVGGSVGLAGLSSLAGVAGTVVSVMGARQEAAFQQDMLSQQIKTAEQNKKRAIFRSQVEAQDTDLEAKQIMAEQIAQQASSGFALTSDSFTSARRKNRVTSRLNASRIRQEGDIEGYGYEQQARGLAAEKRQIGSQMFLNTLSGAVNIGSSVIGGATRVNEARVRQVNNASSRTRVNAR